MDVTFASRRLERAFEQGQVASREWGEVVARKYVQRIDVLRAADTFEDLFELRALRVHPLKGDRKGLFAMTIHDRWRLIVVATGTKVEILEVTNHYGD